jgi:hypothetical protein
VHESRQMLWMQQWLKTTTVKHSEVTKRSLLRCEIRTHSQVLFTKIVVPSIIDIVIQVMNGPYNWYKLWTFNYNEQNGLKFYSTSIAIQQKSNEDSFSKLNKIYNKQNIKRKKTWKKKIFTLLCKILVATEISVLVAHWLPRTILFRYACREILEWWLSFNWSS